MTNTTIYRDIATRTGGDIYIGVVGPVRTGKSTFIKKFLENLVLPNIANSFDAERTRDEMPQSAAGRTVMTTEPKFIPDEAVNITLSDNAAMRVKMVDCVGYLVPEAIGHTENGEPRMVMTPWSAKPVPFEEAAEVGTEKVIREHATIGVVVTTDGSFGEISRENFTEAEHRVIQELRELGKPFAIVLNSATPDDPKSVSLAYALEEEYHAPVALVNCLELNDEDIRHIMELILLEFPISEISIQLPGWTTVLDEDHWLSSQLHDQILACAQNIVKIGDVVPAFQKMESWEYTGHISLNHIDLGTGSAEVMLTLKEPLYYQVMSEMTGFHITDEASLIALMRDLAEVKGKYDKISAALDEVNATGYGIVTPDVEDLRLEEPEIVKQANGYGVRLKASAPSIHLIKAEIETEINPMVGSEQQSEDLVKFLLQEFDEDPKKIWESNIFGTTLHELVNEGLHTKLSHMPAEARAKLSETLEKIINEGSGGLICIIL